MGRYRRAAAVEAALAAGADLILLDRELAREVRRRRPHAPLTVVPDVRRAYARLTQLERGWPARHLIAVGVTGTNGKSSVAAWLHWVLTQLGHPTGLVGTVKVDRGRDVRPATLTTPDARELASHLEAMQAAGLTHVVMEASSHGLDQRRTDGISFRVAVLTNFSADHLDYHATPGDYLAAKCRLFAGLAPGSTALLNADDPASPVMAAGARHAQVLWYGQDPRLPLTGQWQGEAAHVRLGSWAATAPLPGLGAHRLSNALAVLGAAAALGEPPHRAWPALLSYPGLVRRLQVISEPGDAVQVIDDCAHNPANLAAAIRAGAARTRARLHIVYAIRGRRGAAVNALNAAALAEHVPPSAQLHLTWALDLAAADDAVSPEEDQVYQEVLARAGRRHHAWPTAEGAMRAVLQDLKPHDTVLLLGAHAMDSAAEVWRRLVGSHQALRPTRAAGSSPIAAARG